MTVTEDTQPMTLPDIEIVPDDYPTEPIPYPRRSGSTARHTTPARRAAIRSSLIWGAFVLACGGAIGGGAWFAATANTGLAAPASTSTPTGGGVAPAAAGTVVIPTATAASSAPATRKAAVVAPADTGSVLPTPVSSDSTTGTPGDVVSQSGGISIAQPGSTPSDSVTPTSSSASPQSALPPSPVSTQPVANDPGCSNVTYSDGSVHLVCDVQPSASPSGSAS